MMMSRFFFTLAALAVLAVAAPVSAQENASVSAYRDWSVFNPSNPRECYIVSPPTKWEARRGGNKVEVRRGDILLFVTIRPTEGVNKEVSYTGGYPFSPGKNIEIKIGGTAYALAPGSGESQEWAWPADASKDQQLVEAMRAGSSATVTAVSSRGTTTIDEFSLLGFTAALDEAEKLCN